MPGEPGTKKLLQIYGSDLVCVRYRYDHAKNKKWKTVELIVEQGLYKENTDRIHGNKTVDIEIEYEEINHRKAVKDAGGKWNKKNKRWQLPYRKVIALGLNDRIITDEED